MKNFYLFLLLSLTISIVKAQEQDTARGIGYSGLPVLSTSPETGFQCGAFGQISFDMFKNYGNSRQSQQGIGVTYSTKKQFSLLFGGLLFGKDEKYVITNYLEYVNWIDRHYGLGNDASNQIIEFSNDNNQIDTFNFLNYKIDIFKLELSYNRKIGNGWFLGAGTKNYYANNYEELADSTSYSTNEISMNNMIGRYHGIGWNLIYDKRDNINNPYEGAYLLVSNYYFLKWFGADFRFATFELDARKYFNVYNNQILAFRAKFSNTFSNSTIPFSGYQRLGGGRFLRGYFDGTYLDRNLMLFDVEYRLPLFADENAPTWKIWRHLGLVAFASGGKVYNDFAQFNFSDMRFSAGWGLRIMISQQQRTNIRLDYGIGFQDDSAGVGKRQRGFYITVNEAF